jgi:hypothetical protein
MAEILERVTRIEATLEYQNGKLEELGHKMNDVHEFIFTSKGAEAARQAIAEQQLRSHTQRHFLSIGLAGFVGAVAGSIASVIALLNRYSPIVH